MKRIIWVLLSLWIGVSLAPHLLDAVEETVAFKIVVQAENPTSELKKEDIAQLFLKKVKKWKQNDEKVLPVDLLENAPVRAKFSEAIHGKKVSFVKAYWQKQIFSGREVPPVEKESDEEVLKYVAQNLGAIGYVSESAKIDDYKVKVIKILE
jgi:ABC-type phosphate transport system substrate-binding protein